MSLSRVLFTRLFLNILILMLSSLSVGIAIAYPSPAMPIIRHSFEFTPFDESLFGALTSLTAACGPIVTRPLLPRLGRRGTTRVIGLIFILSWVLLVFASSDRKYLCQLHRATIGVAAGGVSSVVPMYIMELSPVDLRSIYGSMHQFALSFGIFFINFLGLCFDWRQLGFISMFVAIILTVALSFVPEPIHVNGRQESKGADSLCGHRYRRPFVIGLLLMFFQQVSGINAVLTNLSAILITRAGPSLAASAQCFAVVCCITVIDRIGRMNAWAVSLFGSALSVFILAGGVKMQWGGVQTVAAFGFLFFFCFGLGPIPWFLPPELFPDYLRPTAVSILSSVNWILSFGIVFLYPAMVASFGVVAVLGFYGIVLVVGGVFGFGALKQPSQVGMGETLLKQEPIEVGFDE